ncbi:hypothetical protein CTI12_AA143390 [Artemisia annua]|uniref:Dihydroxy-acid/6-phosphogluconate dehydratase C-terminal domain-containing protein n=1 Tax=Artemisia annua TaxID=35608 RepID=A0A2U1PJE1_ARTAN|nr:hypothetical protein CTI12_AA143390 [Artemisia annua]
MFSSHDQIVDNLFLKSCFQGKVVVMRGKGAKGGPGMTQLLTPTSAVMGAGLGKEVSLLTNGRFSRSI